MKAIWTHGYYQDWQQPWSHQIPDFRRMNFTTLQMQCTVFGYTTYVTYIWYVTTHSLCQDDSLSRSNWVYSIIFIQQECLKPVFQNGTDAAKLSARQTLFTCLDTGLRLISPFMPFLSEELYQRLPREDGPISICIAPYPVIETCPWKNDDIEKEVELVQKTAKNIRSARSTYNLPNKSKTEAYVLSTCATTKSILQKFTNDLLTTAYCSKLYFDEQPPIGCAILPVTGQCEVHLLLKGLIQVDKELQKLEKKQTQLTQAIDRLNQTINAADYTTKVPEEIRQANTDKLTESEAEITRINAAIESLKLM